MNTEIIKLDKNKIDTALLSKTAEIIRKGGLVAFPTETVYGLGANALDEEAVKKIFQAKGRPSDNPLIVHISSTEMVNDLVKHIPDKGKKLMERFWPGPLTLVMEKSDIVPRIITAGLDTVAVRMPSHVVALALIRESGIPIAAPSANISGKPSPTSAAHVISDLMGKVDVIIDAGVSKVGVESTVVDLTVDPPMVLRPGGITPSQLREVVGDITIDPALKKGASHHLKPKSPGMKYVHYSPKAEVIIVEGHLKIVSEKINGLISEYMQKGLTVGVLATEQTKSFYDGVPVISAGDREHPETIASRLFAALREFDEKSVDIVLAEAVDDDGIGLAIMNRMTKAAGYNIIKAE